MTHRLIAAAVAALTVLALHAEPILALGKWCRNC